VIVAIVLRCLDYAYLVWQNNGAIAAPRQAESGAAFEPSIDWPENSKDTIVIRPNQALRWMIQQAAQHSADQCMRQLFASHEETSLTNACGSVMVASVLPGQQDAGEIREYRLFALL
jgi:hypothetical protein